MDFGKKYDDLLEVVDKGGNIGAYFYDNDPLCGELGKSIVLGKKLGGGRCGTVYKVDLCRGNPCDKLVVKKMTAATSEFTIKKDATKKRLEQFYGRSIDFSGELTIPIFLLGLCASSPYKRTDTGEEVNLPEGSLVCNDEHSEFIISLFTSRLFSSGFSINFLPVFYFATCAGPKLEADYYMFMEEIYMDLFDLMTHVKSDKVIDSLFLQILHAIAVYQKKDKIVHGDLHDSNVFISRNIKTFNGQDLTGAEYFEYKFENQSIYLSAFYPNYTARIGDWDSAVKYDKGRIIGGETTVYGGFAYAKPNWYNESYDVISITRSLFRYTTRRTNLISKVMAWIEGTSVKDIPEYPKIFPDVKTLESKYSHVSPLAILSNPDLMGDYLKPPPKNSKIAVLGEI